jgi:hypothetical protein
MNLQAFSGFAHFTTQHCVTGSLQHIYHCNGYPISEELLLGLGAGVGFIYWHTRGTQPFLGGRANVGHSGEEGMEKAAGRRTGVGVKIYRTGSAAKAEGALLDQLAAKQPVMLVLDMGYLPYFDFGRQEYHFGYHVVVACGYDPQAGQVLIADRDAQLHPIPLSTLAEARGSRFQPFPPRHAWYAFDFNGKHPPDPAEIFRAIQECVHGMLEPPIANLGVQGIRKASRRIHEWPGVLSEEELKNACINSAILIDERGGTGGGLFRFMYGRFLEEAAGITGLAGLREVGRLMREIGERWQQVAEHFSRAYAAPHPEAELDQVCAILPEIANREEAAWRRLAQSVPVSVSL